MKILVVILAIIAITQARRLSHEWSWGDITSLPVDSIKKGLSGDWNGAAQGYAMNKAGLSNQNTIGSYFGQQQPKSPLSGLSSLFGGSNANATQPAAGNNQGFAGLLGQLTGNNQPAVTPAVAPTTPPATTPAVDPATAANAIATLTNPNSTVAQPTATPSNGAFGNLMGNLFKNNQPAQPENNGGFFNMAKGFFGGNSGAAQPSTGGNIFGKLFG